MVARLKFSTDRQPRAGIVLMLCLSVFLVGLSLYHFLQGATPEIIPVIMLSASLTLLLGFSLALFRMKTRYRINVVMLDGSVVNLWRSKKPIALELLDGLTDAMDWHRIGSIEIDAQRSHLRQGVAKGRQQSGSERARTAWSAPPEEPVQDSEGLRTQLRTQSRTQSRSQQRAHSGGRASGRRSKAGQTLFRWFKRRRERSSGADASRPSSEESTAEAQVRQKPFMGAGPVVAMTELTLKARLKMLLARLQALFSR